MVRFFILSAVAVVLVVKLYLLLTIMDRLLGIYSFLTTFILFNILTLAWLRYRDPYHKAKDTDLSNVKPPLISIVVPVKNEEENIRNCVMSCVNQSYKNKEVIIVDDASTDTTPKILDQIRAEVGSENIRILHLSKSVGKKRAIEAASEIAKGEIYAFMDSDCDMESDAVEKAAKVFMSDRLIGALTAQGKVRGAHTGNILLKMQQVYIDGSYRVIKGAESSFNSLTCCSGSLSFYKRAAVQDFIHEWAHDRFLGVDFKFCTDRRMTARVLGSKVVLNENNLHKEEKSHQKIPILQTGNDDLDMMKSSSDADMDDSDTSKPNWNVLFSSSIRVNIGVPNTVQALVKQQIRWKKSFLRSLSSTGRIYWKRPFYAAMLYYVQTGMKFIRPFILLHAVVMLPLAGDIVSPILWLSGIMFTGMIYGVDFRLRNPGDKLWLYRPLFTFLTTFVYTWLLVWAGITIRKQSWR
ncbi:MAG: glycosyltransferase family 2 protein [Thermoproteota archaeon]|nr:glycosyltransferase family 2 protein [Thermoproteota archaeon]